MKMVLTIVIRMLSAKIRSSLSLVLVRRVSLEMGRHAMVSGTHYSHIVSYSIYIYIIYSIYIIYVYILSRVFTKCRSRKSPKYEM